MASVPLSTCHEILLRLLAVPLLRFRAVCKRWRAAIDDRCFVEAHNNKQLSSNTTITIFQDSPGPPFYPLYSFDLEALTITGGLQTIAATTRTGSPLLPDFPVATCNPSTDERLELPQGDFYSNRRAIGLGYDYANDDYKAVVIDCPDRGFGKRVHRTQVPDRGRGKRVHRTQVYSLKSDSWRQIMNCPCDDRMGLIGHVGIFVSGALHWLSRSPSDKKILRIIALDLGTETYRQLALPLFQGRENMKSVAKHFDVLDGCLTVTDYGYSERHHEYGYFEVWVMRDYGAEDSWIKLFSIDQQRQSIPWLGYSLRPVAFLKSKMQVFLRDDDRFYLFDVESGSARAVSIEGLTGTLYAQTIPQSIFRIHDNCGLLSERRRIMTRESNMKRPEDTELTFCVRDAHAPVAIIHSVKKIVRRKSHFHPSRELLGF